MLHLPWRQTVGEKHQRALEAAGGASAEAPDSTCRLFFLLDFPPNAFMLSLTSSLYVGETQPGVSPHPFANLSFQLLSARVPTKQLIMGRQVVCGAAIYYAEGCLTASPARSPCSSQPPVAHHPIFRLGQGCRVLPALPAPSPR